ncbi:zinc ribbon domain-containing protein [Scytonema sp. PCC 10023]|uniref:zinc ribbon domain-containing protein n=1 Tax=Scytonema sp. PCC 10023 TaxID=1680591 RepID=UPI0039C61A1D
MIALERFSDKLKNVDQIANSRRSSGNKSTPTFSQNPRFYKARCGSKVCLQCNTYTGKKELKDRVYSCPECGYITHRDVAAAQVIRNRGETALCRRVSRQPGDCVPLTEELR